MLKEFLLHQRHLVGSVHGGAMMNQDVKVRRIITETKGNNDARFNKP